jgi:deazaflavin-dependent oxidoreductase (nitroreductase family)
MAVELTPNGTYGTKMPNFPRPLAKVAVRLNLVFFRLLGNRVRVQGLPLLLLTTVGARSGQQRHSVLGGFDQRDGTWLIVASAGGSARHPAWYYNLAKHPDDATIEIAGRTMRVRAESLRGAARETAWQQVVARAPGYGPYVRKTDREIPIIHLTLVR